MTVAFGRRAVLRGAVGLAALGGLAGIADLARVAVADPADSHTGLRVGYLPITDAAPLLVAHGAGLYDEATAAHRPVMFRSWSSLTEAFLSRQVDVVHLLMPMAVQLRYALGGAGQVIGWNHTNGSALTVAPQITDLEQLVGTQVAIPAWWSIHNIVLQKMLRARGIRPVVREEPSKSARTVGLIVMSPSDMVPALANGAISGFTVADPFHAVAEARGVGRIHTFLGDVWRDHACCALLVHQDVIDREPAAVQSLADSMLAAQQVIADDRAAAGRLLSDGRYLPQPAPAVARALDYDPDGFDLAHPEWAPQRIGFRGFPFAGYTAAMVGAMHDTIVDGDRRFLDRVAPEDVHRDLVDDRFVRRAIDAAGGPSALGLPADLSREEQVVLS